MAVQNVHSPRNVEPSPPSFFPVNQVNSSAQPSMENAIRNPVTDNGMAQTDHLRPSLHYTPAKNWMNDPNGLVQTSTGYHLFYQYNPNGNLWGDIAWGHARSNDLLTWEELPVAINPDDVMAFSGSAVESEPGQLKHVGITERALVAAFTGHHPATAVEDQRIVTSIDDGASWQPISDGPVINRAQKHFRDPRLFWHGASESWVMAVSLALEHRIVFYGSRDLLNWEERGSFSSTDAPGVEWECPELVQFADPDKPGEELWMLKIDVSSGAPAGGSGGKYFLGHFDGYEFDAAPRIGSFDEAAVATAWIDYGADFYAAQRFSSLHSDTAPVWLGWASNWLYARQTPDFPGRGCQSLPRTLHLESSQGGCRLAQRPVPGVTRLRREPTVSIPLEVPANGETRPRYTGKVFDLECRLDRWSADNFGLCLAKGDGCETRLGFRPDENRCYIDRRHSGALQVADSFPGVHSAPLDFDGPIDLRVIIDRSVVEVFINNGERVLTDLIYPDTDAVEVTLFAEGGQLSLSSAQCWSLETPR